jgi:hypothetical protein
MCRGIQGIWEGDAHNSGSYESMETTTPGSILYREGVHRPSHPALLPPAAPAKPRKVRLMKFLADFNLTINYRPGRGTNVSDALSLTPSPTRQT